jgi:hypothetical protein
MHNPRALDREVEVFTWSLDANPDVVREFDWEDGEARSPVSWASAVVPSAALIAATTVALRGGIL